MTFKETEHEVKHFILLRSLVNLLHVEEFEVTLNSFAELKEGVSVSFTVDEVKQVQTIPWWTIITTTYKNQL